MKRYTHRTLDGAVACCYPEDFVLDMEDEHYAAYEETMLCLCEYEETGLTPAEIMELKQRVADAEPVKRGRWAHIGGDEWCCNCCGYVKTTESCSDKPVYKFCPNCGAKMENEADNA